MFLLPLPWLPSHQAPAREGGQEDQHHCALIPHLAELHLPEPAEFWPADLRRAGRRAQLQCQAVSGGLIGIVGSSLRIFTIPRLGVKVKQDPMPLAYTPRKILLDPATKHDITVESEHHTMAPDVQVARFALQPGEESRRQSSLLRPACASSSAPEARSSISSALAFVVKAGLLGLRLGASAAAPVLLALPGVLASVLDVEASAFVAVAALWIVDR
ncbi:hypothetical protein PtA15_8A283 [Puccinia triticina]|uniref:Uncharacterized protein n=1 Tax=Puccinia triticina TaxID=208348 RepID=A0ABY7CQA5_9BASI|nr:uncharacterized protein PtA15_8A283 [Puccinia triticina]WAQ87379.1 hypothetical protein PtA15_8A283 [Puccinia triticina]WAR57233.1 hypothetical protein PtB15_8B280 [Puccinia triticina]